MQIKCIFSNSIDNLIEEFSSFFPFGLLKRLFFVHNLSVLHHTSAGYSHLAQLIESLTLNFLLEAIRQQQLPNLPEIES